MRRCITAVMGYRACRKSAPRKPDLCTSAVQTLVHPCLLKPEQLKLFWVIMSISSREKSVSETSKVPFLSDIDPDPQRWKGCLNPTDINRSQIPRYPWVSYQQTDLFPCPTLLCLHLSEQGVCTSLSECCLEARKQSPVKRGDLATPALIFREFSESRHHSMGVKGFLLE